VFALCAVALVSAVAFFDERAMCVLQQETPVFASFFDAEQKPCFEFKQ
jgi:hypothetical protein